MAESNRTAVNLVTDAYERAKSGQASMRTEWVENYQLYRAYVQARTDGRSNLFVPKVFADIETLLPREMEALFAQRPYVGVLPREARDVGSAKLMEQLIDYQWAERLRLVVPMVKVLKDKAFYGTSIVKTGWRLETKTRKRSVRVPRPVLGNQRLGQAFGVFDTQAQSYQVTVWDDPWLWHVDLFNFFIDPDADSLDSANFVVERAFLRPDELRRYAEAPQAIYDREAVERAIEHAAGGDLPTHERRTSVGLDEPARDDHKVELLEYWEDDRLVVIANGEDVLRDDDNPFWHCHKPYVALTDTPVPHEFWGIGQVEMNKPLQSALNSWTNVKMDNANMTINRMWKAARHANINEDELVARPGGIVHVDDPNSLLPLEMATLPPEAWQVEDSLQRQMELVNGINDYLRGSTPGRKDLATTVNMLQEAGNYRFKLKIQLDSEGIVELARHFIELNQQFMDRPRMIRLMGDQGMEFVQVAPEDIAGSFDLAPTSAVTEPLVSKAVRREQFLQVFNLLRQDPEIDQQELKRRLLALYDIKDADKLLVAAQQLAPGQMGAGMPPGMSPQGPPQGPPTGAMMGPGGPMMPMMPPDMGMSAPSPEEMMGQ